MSDVFISAQGLHDLQRNGTPVVTLAVWSDETHAAFDGVPVGARPHIPGAIDTELGSDFAAPAGGPRGLSGSRPLPAIADVQQRVRDWGIDDDSVVVVYDHDRALQAARAWWVLRWAGIRQVLILDGGFAAWAEAGLPLAAQTLPVKPGTAVVSPGQLPQLDEAGAAALARTGVLLDTRIRPNYEGGATAAGEPARGHIPGAVSTPAADNLDANGRFLAPELLRRYLANAGVSDANPVGVYCGAGVSAAHTIAVLYSLGITAPMYVGSWSAWSADPTRPVARGPAPG